MASSSQSKKPGRKSGKRRTRPSRKVPKDKYPGLIGSLVLLLFTGAIVTLLFMLPLPPGAGPKIRPPFEEFPENIIKEPLKERSAPKAPIRPPGKSLPRVAILIDDMGYDRLLDTAFLQLDAPLSFAFLPQAPHTFELAQEAHRLKKNVLVHLPMEPENGNLNPGPGVLCVNMNLNTMLRVLRSDLDSVPGAIGVNNHMGSKFTKDRKSMELVLAEIKRRGLFFVDSRTSKNSVAFMVARSMGIPAIERSVFLDHDHRPKAIRAEIKRMVALAHEKGSVLAIGHPVKSTLRVLYEELPEINKKVKIVPVEQILIN